MTNGLPDDHKMRAGAGGPVMRGARLTGMMQRVVASQTAPDPAAAGWLVLPGVPSSVAVARRLVAEALAGSPRSDDLVLAVSELATNAVNWSASGEGGFFLVRVRRVTLWARIEVWDAGPASVARAPGNGFGLTIVGEVTDRCGMNLHDGGRRTAWAEVTWPL